MTEQEKTKLNDEASTRILIVDDEAAHTRALCDTLRDHGYDTTGFTSGAEALAALRLRKFDLLLSDLTMPGMNGIALLQAACELDPELVGVIITGQGTIASAVEAMKSGAFDYVLKPFKVSVVLPVIARALAMRKLRMENAALEACVRLRTAELQKANEDLESFSYSVSHDLRGPLRTICSYTSILTDEYAASMSPDARGLLDKVVAGARRMELLISDLLSFSRLGRQPILKRPVKVSKLVCEAIDELDKEKQGRNVTIDVGNLPDCAGDPSLLRQVFINLLSNALKFTRYTENASITIGCNRDANENIYFVRDNGAGFDMQYAEKLFGVFQRLHGATDFEGTGIGLSIVQRIVQRHGGRIWAEAEVNKGAIFSIALPVMAELPATSR